MFSVDNDTNNQAPIRAKGMAGNPKRMSTDLLMFLNVNPNLNKLFRKWTIAVIAIAISIGKKITKIGVRIVPTPNPEKKVRIEVKNDTIPIMKYSINLVLGINHT